MPSPRAFFRAAGSSPSVIVRVARIAGIAIVVVVALFCALLLAVRFVVFPRVEDYRDDLTAALASQLKQPVEIDGLATGWDGWNPKIILHGFRVRSAAGPASSPLLDLPQVEMVVAWTSLPLFDLRLKQLVLEQPRLAVRRDRDGVLHIAGMDSRVSHRWRWRATGTGVTTRTRRRPPRARWGRGSASHVRARQTRATSFTPFSGSSIRPPLTIRISAASPAP